jgi:hypothetical protein
MEYLPLDRYAQVRADLKAWSFGIVRHGKSALATILCGSAASYFQYCGGHVTAVIAWTAGVIAFMIGAFLGWRDERRAKENAMPTIEGSWIRKVFKNPDGTLATGILKLTFDGKKLSGTFEEGDIDHKIDGYYDANNRQFKTTVTRTHISGSEPRKNQECISWAIGNDTLLYYTPDNGFGHGEIGTYSRQGTNPLLPPIFTRFSLSPL